MRRARCVRKLCSSKDRRRPMLSPKQTYDPPAAMSDPAIRHSQDFAEVLGHIQQTRQRVFAQANTALIDLYWRVGQTLSHKVAPKAAGAKAW
jgi:hypothetical protein